MTTDVELLNFIITNFPYFKDEKTYNNKKVYFYKRAQLLTSDLTHKKFENRNCYRFIQFSRMLQIIKFHKL